MGKKGKGKDAKKKDKKDKKKGRKSSMKRYSQKRETVRQVEPEPVYIEVQPKIEEPCIFNCSQQTVAYRPNSLPGLLEHPKTLAVVGSETGTYDSICKLIHAGFRCADRVYLMVPWGNYVVFRNPNTEKPQYFVFDGCTCNVNRFRYLDLSCGTASLLYFEELHKAVNYIIMSRMRREEIKNLKRSMVDDVCQEMYGSQHI